ncbi:glutaredoxin family protein [Candidatus Berkelbacteria bacterium]|nr:glutaredoxin family protein [Candidatus Berkelbacteria bacterium]
MKTVTIYSTPTCPYCKMEKAFLAAKGIAFTDIDVSADRAKQDQMVQKSGQMGVPVTVVTDEQDHEELLVGFDQVGLTKALGLTA